MIKFKGTFDRIVKLADGTGIVSFVTSDNNAIEELSKIDGTIAQKVEVKKFTEKRSLNANSYFHLLVGKIAEAVKLPMSEVKRKMVFDYGTQLGAFRAEATVPLEAAFTYFQIIRESKGTKRPCVDVIVWKPTHTLDKAEMARLIDGVVEEAKQLGIETRTPNEIADMLNLWEQEDEL